MSAGQRERELSLFTSPITTTYYFARFLLSTAVSLLHWMRRHVVSCAVVTLIAVSVAVLDNIPGPHTEAASIAAWWVVLGILSSVGFGTGLHTFVLYLGPHIAKVTLTASTCNTLLFDQYGSHAFECVEIEGASVSPLSIFAMVWPAASLWGFGTAIGELPPYFLARTARLAKMQLAAAAGTAEAQEEVEGVEDGWSARLAESVVSKFGFVGILLFASIPNPLFDLAGLLCGHFLVPFWTFFGATALGKAVFKVSMQVLMGYSKDIGGKVAAMVAKEKAKLHGTYVPNASGDGWSVGSIWQVILGTMLAYFAISIVNTLAQQQYTNELARKRKRE